MKLDKFKLSRIVIEEIEKLPGEHQGQVSAALLFWIFNDDTSLEATLSEEVLKDYRKIKDMLSRKVSCSRKAQQRRASGVQRKPSPKAPSPSVDAPVFANYINISRLRPVEVKGPYSHCPPFNYYSTDSEGRVFFFLLVGIGERHGDVIAYDNLVRPQPGQCDVGLSVMHM